MEAMKETELQEWDASHAGGVPIQASPAPFLEGHWEIAFLYFGALLFGIWFGVTAERFENVMGFCTTCAAVGFAVFVLGSLASDDLLRTNSRHVFFLAVFFAFSVCLFHFIRLKAEPAGLV
jgi:hypothetical protein